MLKVWGNFSAALGTLLITNQAMDSPISFLKAERWRKTPEPELPAEPSQVHFTTGPMKNN
jgi:hypothetical protein